jgi:hypothetical protein
MTAICCNSLPVCLIRSFHRDRSPEDTSLRSRFRCNGVGVPTEERTDLRERLRTDAPDAADILDAAKRSALIAVIDNPVRQSLADFGKLQPLHPSGRVDFDGVVPLARVQAGDLNGRNSPAVPECQMRCQQQDRQRPASAKKPAVALRKSPADTADGRLLRSPRRWRSDFRRLRGRRGGDVWQCRGDGVHEGPPVNATERRDRTSLMLPVDATCEKMEPAGTARVSR